MIRFLGSILCLETNHRRQSSQLADLEAEADSQQSLGTLELAANGSSILCLTRLGLWYAATAYQPSPNSASPFFP